MVTLLNLPREVRDEILEYIIFARTPTPKTLADLDAQTPKRKYPHTQSRFFCNEQPFESFQTAHFLLLINKQLHHETKELLNLRGGITYELNVNLVYESVIIPHWTCVPLAMDVVPLLKVNFQSIGKFRQGTFRGQAVPDPQQRRRRTVPLYVSDMYYLLRDLLYRDQNVRPQVKGARRRGIACRVLEIDCIDPENKELLAPESHNPGDYSLLQVHDMDTGSLPTPGIEEWLVRPEWVAANISEHLPTRIREGSYLGTLGQILHDAPFYSRVGCIVIKVNGTMARSIDVGQILADIKFSPGSASWIPVENFLDHWIMWKEKAIQGRKDRGFKVAELPSDWKEKTRTAYHYQPERKSTDEEVKARFRRLSDQFDYI
jgi:hypothetical protein